MNNELQQIKDRHTYALLDLNLRNTQHMTPEYINLLTDLQALINMYESPCYVIRYGNYYPIEMHSHWRTREEAEEEFSRMHLSPDMGIEEC